MNVMQESAHIRVISLVLAFSVIVGAWLLFEYSNRPLPHATASTENSAKNEVRYQPSSRPTPLATVSAKTQSDVNLTFKCEKDGRISFSDQPCSSNEKTISTMATKKSSPGNASNNLERLQRQVAAMEASRLEHEKRHSSLAETGNTGGNARSKDFRCREIDKEITQIDSRLRQAHSAQYGDHLTENRWKLNKERFSIGC
jgi:cytoskeletal protein RodZ